MPDPSGSSRCGTTVSASIPSLPTISSPFSSGSTEASIPALESVWPCASAWWNGTADASGSSPAPARAPRFTLACPNGNKASLQLISYIYRMFRILIIEDNPADAQILQMALERAGVPLEIIHLDDGAKAMEYLSAGKSSHCDLVLLDLNLQIGRASCRER